MKNTFGNNVSITLFGESHGRGIGAVLDGLAPGIEIDEDFINFQLGLRRPIGDISTKRSEQDKFIIYSGVFAGKTTGTPICIVIPNEDTKSEDYSEINGRARPSHADFTAFSKYHGFEDYRGGGHFSGRITAALVAAGAIAVKALKDKGIIIGSHILECGGVRDRSFENIEAEIDSLNKKAFAVLDDNKGEQIKAEILRAKKEGDSVGGILETCISGLPAGLGEPWFDSIEGLISHGIFSIPAVKGIEFGAGFGITSLRGSNANDSFYCENGKIHTKTNNNGGINGGITNGMPIVFKTAIKPTPTIAKPQQTVDFLNMTNCVLEGKGRHDPCIVHRARVVVDSMIALILCDILTGRFGTDWLA